MPSEEELRTHCSEALAPLQGPEAGRFRLEPAPHRVGQAPPRPVAGTRAPASIRRRMAAADEVLYDKDADLSVLEGKTVAILGYGSQGHAHALNLKDSGVKVVVGLRPDSSSRDDAEGEGLEVMDVADAASAGDIVMILLPDEKQAQIWREEISDGIADGNLLMFAHGFAIRFGQIEPPPGVDVGMVAPKGPGHLVRREFVDGAGRALPDGRPPGRDRHRPRPGARLRQRHRRRPRRDHRDHLQGRGRDRPLRRAGRALRRRHRAGPGGLRDPGRGRLRPAPRLLRVPARAEADRRPDVRARASRGCATRSPTRPSTAT